MQNINHVTISGNLVADCDKRMAGETPLISFSVAVNDRKKDGDEWIDYPNYIDCTCFGKFAQVISEQMVKGVKVCVSGKLRQERWEKDGQKRSKVSVVADNIEIMRAAPAEAPAKGKKGKKASDDDIPW